MNITFALRNGFKILEFDLWDDGRVRNLQVYDEGLAQGVLKQKDCILSPEILLDLMQYYLGGSGELEDYINHIRQHGFYSPYQPALDIWIK